MNTSSRSRYMIPSPKDLEWGMVVKSVGTQSIAPGADYPPIEHPSRYLFTKTSGRILDEFQLVFIAKGAGFFTSRTLGCELKVKSGDMLLLFPGEWHSYWPDPQTGWDEYWIGFNGPIANNWLNAGFLSADCPVLHPSNVAKLVADYSQALSLSVDQKYSYHQVLAALASNILFSAIYSDRNRTYEENMSSAFISRAREVVLSNLPTISGEDLAERLGLGYSKFRKMFKDYTGMAPGQYILEARIARARELLTNTNLQIQEIAWNLGFENPDYFNTVFKRVDGLTPGAFRSRTRNGL